MHLKMLCLPSTPASPAQFAFNSQLASRPAQIGFSPGESSHGFLPLVATCLATGGPWTGHYVWLPIACYDLWHGLNISSYPAFVSLSPATVALLVFASPPLHSPEDFACTHILSRGAHSPGGATS